MRVRPDAVNANLTKVFCASSVGDTTESLDRGTRNRKVGRVSRSTFSVRFLLILAILATAAILLGGDPWGPI
jgi:hypothetical protein